MDIVPSFGQLKSSRCGQSGAFDEGTLAIAGRIVRANSHFGSTVDALPRGAGMASSANRSTPNRPIVDTVNK
jgi:hypothetical protein